MNENTQPNDENPADGRSESNGGLGMKFVCSEYRCNWYGMEAEVLTAPNPFEAGDTLYACPECKTVGSVVDACDEPECWKASSCGTPTENGYRRTCGKHMPNEQN